MDDLTADLIPAPSAEEILEKRRRAHRAAAKRSYSRKKVRQQRETEPETETFAATAFAREDEYESESDPPPKRRRGRIEEADIQIDYDELKKMVLKILEERETSTKPAVAGGMAGYAGPP